MGQQQLLLLVLGLCIVGLAAYVGINAFSENRIKSNADAMVTDAMRLANDIQVWAMLPTHLGGGGGSARALDRLTTDVGLDGVGIKVGGGGCEAEEYGNVNGCFALSNAKSPDCPEDPTPSVDGGHTAYLNARNEQTGNRVCMLITGVRDTNIGVVVVYGT